MPFSTNMPLFTVVLAAVVIVVTAASARRRRPTEGRVWIVLAVLIAIVATLALILAMRHGG